jgi:hypothetical protein
LSVAVTSARIQSQQRLYLFQVVDLVPRVPEDGRRVGTDEPQPAVLVCQEHRVSEVFEDDPNQIGDRDIHVLHGDDVSERFEPGTGQFPRVDQGTFLSQRAPLPLRVCAHRPLSSVEGVSGLESRDDFVDELRWCAHGLANALVDDGTRV